MTIKSFPSSFHERRTPGNHSWEPWSSSLVAKGPFESQSLTPSSDMSKPPYNSPGRAEHNGCNMLRECTFGFLCKDAIVRKGFLLCRDTREQFWSVESWQSVGLPQEAADHTDTAPSDFLPPPFFFLHSAAFVISHSAPHTTFNLTPLTLRNMYVHPPFWWVYWYVTLIFIAA